MARKSDLAQRTREIGSDLFQRMKGESPSIFDKSWWSGRIMEWCMRDEAFKVEMFRFVDVLPQLGDSRAVASHLKQYFCRPEQDFPAALQWGLKAVSPGSPVAKMAAKTINKNVNGMAAQFIAGSTGAEALPSLLQLRTQRMAFTVDVLGEKTVSQEECEQYKARYLSLIDDLSAGTGDWDGDPLLDGDAYGQIPRVNISVKLSALYSQADVLDFDHSVDALLEQLRPIVRSARDAGVFVNLDMEQYAMKDLTIEVFERLLTEPEFRDGPHCGLALQAYLKDARGDLERLIKFSKKRKRTFTVRLVKGAYWDYETVLAQQHGWRIPVFEEKAATDACFEDMTDMLLATKGQVRTAIGSHNVRSIAHAAARAEALGLPASALEYQALYGMAEPIKAALVGMGYRVRNYVPVGELIPGMAYLVRRLLENTSNEGFLRSTFVEAVDTDTLLQAPMPRGVSAAPPIAAPGWGGNAAFLDFRESEARQRVPKALRQVEKKTLGKHVPVVVGGEKRTNRDHIPSLYPADPNVVVAQAACATIEDVDEAVALSVTAGRRWDRVPSSDRADILRRAADRLEADRLRLAALQVYEVGKNIREADADVCEAIDFLRYYAAEIERLAAGARVDSYPGEQNRLTYRARGVCAVIAPWNFPLAIIAGMTAAALAAGNAVVMKPAEQSPACAFALYQALIAAGVPNDVLHFLPGVGETIGAHLVRHAEVDVIAFTGSRAVGLEILREAASIRPGQRGLKKVIAEMGGKNAIIVDDDADLDEVVAGVVGSAFGFQGQKCSACSRAIIVGDSYGPFVKRLIEATASLHIGPPTDPHFKVNTVIDAESQARINATIEAATSEVELGIRRTVPTTGYYVGPTVFVGADPAHSLCQEEIFGPVVAVLRAPDFDSAVDIANGTAYALTGGLYSRSPAHIAAARRELAVGNLYINRKITGALVGRQPFGGFAMSGVGSKAGGPDYLLQFMEPRCVTENTMRRGFSPETV